MNPDYILKGKGQIALQQPEWAKYASGAAASAPASPDFAATVEAHMDAHAEKRVAKTAAKAAANGPHRYLKAEQETERLNRSTTSNRTSTQTVAEDEPAQENTATDKTASSEIGADGSLYPERKKVAATQMNNFNHGGSSKKTVGPDVDNVDYTFEDFLDTINPLQQIPVVNMIYRHLTGDDISGPAKVMGSALYWGPMGVVTGAIDAIFEQEKGGSVGETMVAGLLGVDTPNAHKLPSNKIKAQETMLASAAPEENIAIKAANTHRVAAKAAPAKQPFGGVMGTETPSQIANEDTALAAARTDIAESNTAEKDAVDEESARILANAQPVKPPVQHAPMEADGHKLYSLAGVARHPSVASHMPMRDMPDVRLKTYGKEIARSTPAGNLKDGAGLLGLQKPAANLAAVPNDNMDIPATVLPDPGFSAPLQMPAANTNVQTPSGNPIPAQLIQDMMLMNMQKYQDMKGGAARGSSLDING